MKFYGIDLGTTNSAMYRYEKGEFTQLTPLIPSVVDYTDNVVGIEAKKNIISKPGNDIRSSFKVDLPMEFAIAASTRLLDELVRVAGVTLSESSFVISTPAYFSASQRAATIEAAERAGMTVAAIVNEPTAAALAYNTDIKTLTAVYDLGGGTFDISIIDTRFDKYEVILTDGVKLGGDDLDNFIVERIIKPKGRFKAHVADYSIVGPMLKELAEKVKITIGTTRQDCVVPMEIPLLRDVFDNPNIVITVEEYKAAVKYLFGRTANRFTALLAKSLYDPSSIEFVMVGGATRDPYLRELIEGETGIIPVPVTYDPDRIVAEGSAIYAYAIEQHGQEWSRIVEVTQAIGFADYTGEMIVVVPSNSQLPLKRDYVLQNPTEARGMSLEVYQGNNREAVDNTYLGMMEYGFMDGLVGPLEAWVTVSFNIDGNGIIIIEAAELGGDKKVMRLET